MATDKGKGRGAGRGKGKGKGENGDGDDERREPYKEQGHAVQVHEAYLKHRLEGGEPASPEAYRRAIEQFQKLPGAVRSTPVVVPKQETDDTTEGEVDDTGKKRDGR